MLKHIKCYFIKLLMILNSVNSETNQRCGKSIFLLHYNSVLPSHFLNTSSGFFCCIFSMFFHHEVSLQLRIVIFVRTFGFRTVLEQSVIFPFPLSFLNSNITSSPNQLVGRPREGIVAKKITPLHPHRGVDLVTPLQS